MSIQKPSITLQLFILFSMLSVEARAADFESLSIGQTVEHRNLTLGRFEIELPAGFWHVIHKARVFDDGRSGGALDRLQYSIAVGQYNGPGFSTVVHFLTPANTFRVGKWVREPCQEFPAPLTKDILKGRMYMPECFLTAVLNGPGAISPGDPAVGDIFAWFGRGGEINSGTNLFLVHNSKYYGGDFIHINSYFHLPAGGIELSQRFVASVHQWGQAMAMQVQDLVTRNSAVAVMPALPITDTK